jgi:U6 snRNA-associated Sm-like protein LSm4
VLILTRSRSKDPPAYTVDSPRHCFSTPSLASAFLSQRLGIDIGKRTNITTSTIDQHIHSIMLPLGLLTAAQGQPILVELKNGETLNGHLVNCDTWMNLTLKEVVQTSPEGDRFFRLAEAYVRGNNVRLVQAEVDILRAADWQTDQIFESARRDRGFG